MDCPKLTGSIPEKLFAGIKGAPAEDMFYGTFYGCSGVSGSIPENLFAGIKGAPAKDMFLGTFYNCSGLSGSIPEKLFAGIEGAPAENMFYGTFADCAKLTGKVSSDFFGNVSDITQEFITTNKTFEGSGIKFVASLDPKNSFKVTTTDDTTEFSFTITAAGDFLVKCADDQDVQTYTYDEPNAGRAPITCTYDNAGTYTILIDGLATKYGSGNGFDEISTSISFAGNKNLVKIEGSLGKIFPTLQGNQQPDFFKTFAECSNLGGKIPADLFKGVSGAPTEWMFQSTFNGCSGLTGSIPEKLFAGIKGAPANNMFYLQSPLKQAQYLEL